MPSRIDNQLCVACGNPLLFPFNEFRTCTRCTEILKKAQYNAKIHGKSKGQRRTHLNAKRDAIFIATRPLGTDV